ncbi:MAG: hypothetical protein KAW12_28145 [Candidatus Aminicenantes bacterium]|nr:hypothetical protein [Candidatus Aminicenantes bacterium]
MQKLPALPIDKYRRAIEESIEKNPVTIITAETGAGKSTRVPLWLWKQKKKVMVTQPRRIAARSLALYLARLAGTDLGKEIGFQTGFDSSKSRDTTLFYVTDGVQMIREIKEQGRYDILILDEVHEWNLNQEVLIGIVKKNLDKNYYRKKGRRVVVMSATLQAEKLSVFLNNAPVISVPGRGFPVTMHHNNPHFLLPDTAQMVEFEKNVLVFQPGKSEIGEFIESLKEMLAAEKIKAKILPLHAELTLKEQSKVFEHYALPKVIVATDIAQTSLTIDDIDAVVDSGIKKEIRLIKGIEGLYPVDISAAECMQRAGRAGRVKSGQYFLCAELDIQDRLPFPEPEIRRLNLESVVLRLIKSGIAPLDFPFFHSPAKNLIFKATRKLKIFGAISRAGEITPEGSRMAELPVSLRSAKLLLEAGKANRKVVDFAIKLIAILETKGIVNKEYIGEKYSNAPYNSDLLNQLALWDALRINKKVIGHKKLALAREVHRELRRRLDVPQVKGSLSAKEVRMLYRAILSAFVDEVYTREGGLYMRDNEARQLDRTSVLFEAQPGMIAGLPFDVVYSRENRETGEKESKFIPLITFASELTLEILDDLKPYSYEKQEKIEIEKGKIRVFREYFFGGQLLKSLRTAPRLQDREERERVVQAVLEWYREAAPPTRKLLQDIHSRKEKIEQDFAKIEKIVKGKLKPFDYYWLDFLAREMRAYLKYDDLPMFFQLHKGFSRITLKNLLPHHFIEELKRVRWPSSFQAGGENLKIFFIGEKPFVKIDYPLFEKVKEEETILPTGERVGIIIKDRKYLQWEEVASEFNRWKRQDVFEMRLKNNRKAVNIEDLLEVPFPQTLTAGNGMENAPLEYYTVPEIKEGNLYLKYFLEEEEAGKYFAAHASLWEQYKKNYKKTKLDNIFKQKGWKIK